MRIGNGGEPQDFQRALAVEVTVGAVLPFGNSRETVPCAIQTSVRALEMIVAKSPPGAIALP